MSKILEYSKQFIDNKCSVNFCSLATLNMSGVMCSDCLPNIKNLIIYSNFPSFRYTKRLEFQSTDDPEIVEEIFNKARYVTEIIFHPVKFFGNDTFYASQYDFILNSHLEKLTIGTTIDDFEYLSNLYMDELIINTMVSASPYFLIHKLRYVKKFIYTFMTVKHNKPLKYFELPLHADQRLEKFELINMSSELFFLDISNFGKRLNYFSTTGFEVHSNTVFENVLTLGINCSYITREKITDYRKWFPNALYINVTLFNRNINHDIIALIYEFYPDAIIQIDGIALSLIEPTIFKNQVIVLINFSNTNFNEFIFEQGVTIKMQNDKWKIPIVSNLYLDNAEIYSSSDKEHYLVKKNINRINSLVLDGENKIYYENLVDSIVLELHKASLLNINLIPTTSVISLEITSHEIVELIIDENTFPSIERVMIDNVRCSLNRHIESLDAKNSILLSTCNKRVVVKEAFIASCELKYINTIAFFNSFKLYNSSFDFPNTILSIYSFNELEIINNTGGQISLDVTEDCSTKFIIKNNNLCFRGKLMLSNKRQLLADELKGVNIHY